MRAFLRSWLPVFLWTGLMFCLSTGVGGGEHSRWILATALRWLHIAVSSQEFEYLHHLMRKGAHLTEYAILAVLFWRALSLRGGRPGWGWTGRTWGEAWLLAVAFAVSDEFHQLFVPGRGSQVSDVVIDASGALAGLALAWVACRSLRKTTS